MLIEKDPFDHIKLIRMLIDKTPCRTDGNYCGFLNGKTICAGRYRRKCNGVESPVNKTAAKEEAIEIGLNSEGNNFVAIESNGNSGDAGFIKLQLSQEAPQGIENTMDGAKAVKFIQNGQIFILRGEKIYTITGQEL